jgi:hypothetical protein
VGNNELPPEEEDLNDLSSKLHEGLHSCRSIVSNYRNLLSGNDAPSSNDNDPSDQSHESLSGIDER